MQGSFYMPFDSVAVCCGLSVLLHFWCVAVCYVVKGLFHTCVGPRLSMTEGSVIHTPLQNNIHVLRSKGLVSHMCRAVAFKFSN